MGTFILSSALAKGCRFLDCYLVTVMPLFRGYFDWWSQFQNRPLVLGQRFRLGIERGTQLSLSFLLGELVVPNVAVWMALQMFDKFLVTFLSATVVLPS